MTDEIKQAYIKLYGVSGFIDDVHPMFTAGFKSRNTEIKELKDRKEILLKYINESLYNSADLKEEIEELKKCNAVLGDSIKFKQAEIEKLREAIINLEWQIEEIEESKNI